MIFGGNNFIIAQLLPGRNSRQVKERLEILNCSESDISWTVDECHELLEIIGTSGEKLSWAKISMQLTNKR